MNSHEILINKQQLQFESEKTMPNRSHLSNKLIAGLFGIFIAAMMSGVNNRVGALGLTDIRGIYGLSVDDSSWINTAYTVGELIVMPFASWFAVTLSIRRYHLIMLSTCCITAVILPLVNNLELLIFLRFIQGMSSGALIPILMMAALKFLPIQIRLHGLALYAMTATFAPNIAIYFTGCWTDSFHNWRLIYWQIIPLCILAGSLVYWGLPKEEIKYERFQQGNWFGLSLGSIGLSLLAIGLSQGIRLNWFNSPFILICISCGIITIGCYMVAEYFHKTPFISPQLLTRRNLGIGTLLFVCLLIVLLSGSLLPAKFLTHIQNFRAMQLSPIGLTIALPQLLMGSLVSLSLYQKWIDARIVLSLGLIIISISCFYGAHITPNWHFQQFLIAQILQAIGQPMTVVSILFLMTSVLNPSEGPYFSGTINTFRAFSSLLGSSIIGQFIIVRGRFHREMLTDGSILSSYNAIGTIEPTTLQASIKQQAFILSVSDAYIALAVLALILTPICLTLDYVSPPNIENVK